MEPSTALADGIVYLRAGALDRAARSFAAAESGTDDPRIRSEALRRLGDVKRRRAKWDEAERLLDEAERIAKEHALRDHLAAARNIRGAIRVQRGDFEAAIEIFLDALRDDPSPRQRGLVCQNLGTAHAQRGAHEEAAGWYARSAAAFAEAGCLRERVMALVNQGNVRLDQGDPRAAEETFREALQAALDLPQGDAELQAAAELNLAEALALQCRELDDAYDLLLRATGHFSAAKDLPSRVACHRVFAVVTEAQGHRELAVGALERGLELAREIRSGPEIAYFERELRRVRGDFPESTSIAGYGP